jgi:mRNA-degrading endonuclease toxin of MazEF toxin-antitoxin module
MPILWAGKEWNPIKAMTDDGQARRCLPGSVSTRCGREGQEAAVVVVQADTYNQKLRHVIVAEVTTNLTGATDPANLWVDITSSDGQATGLVQDSIITCLHLMTMSEDRIGNVIGKLSSGLLQKLDACLKVAMSLP